MDSKEIAKKYGVQDVDACIDMQWKQPTHFLWVRAEGKDYLCIKVHGFLYCVTTDEYIDKKYSYKVFELFVNVWYAPQIHDILPYIEYKEVQNG